MEALEVLELLEEFEEVENALEVDKEVEREFSLEKNLSWKNSLFFWDFSLSLENFLFFSRFSSLSSFSPKIIEMKSTCKIMWWNGLMENQFFLWALSKKQPFSDLLLHPHLSANGQCQSNACTHQNRWLHPLSFKSFNSSSSVRYYDFHFRKWFGLYHVRFLSSIIQIQG